MTESISSPTQAAYEHNGRPVSREAFYAIACDPARSVAVEACAGAGKTWMLVSRMLRALLDGCAPPTSMWASAARRNCTNRTKWCICAMC